MTSHSFIDPHRAVPRIALAAALGTLAGLAAASRYSAVIAWLTGWDVAAAVLLALSWKRIAGSDASATKARAAAEDPGRTLVYALVLFTSTSSLLATTPLVRGAKGLAPHQTTELLALCLATVALSWALTHTAFALRYAHLYYRSDAEGIGGVDFPGGGSPGYFDFAYLAFTVGMCFQVSDTSIASPQIRRTVLLHAALSFVYNTTILAFVLNLAFGLAN